MFGVGDEVLCINDSDPPQSPPHMVVKGNTYTVTRMEIRPRIAGLIGPFMVMKPAVYVFVAGVPSPKGIGFFAERFVKVDKKSRATDITVFKEIADGTRVVPLEDAPVRKREKAGG